MPQLDFSTYLPQVFWLVVTFIALYLIMWKIAVPRIANSLEARQKRIEDYLDRAADAKKEAEETLAAYEQAIALKPDHPEAHFNLGNLLARGGHGADAIASYRQAIAEGPHLRDPKVAAVAAKRRAAFAA